MRIGVYNRHWKTMGGGEKFGAGIADALQGEHVVELMSEEPLELSAFEERFGLDLHRVTVRTVGDEINAVSKASADYDLFINVSYLSADHSRARHGIYVVHFPSPLGVVLTGWRRGLAPISSLVHRGAQPVPNRWGEGFHPTHFGRRPVTWTNGCAEIFILPERENLDLRIRFGHHRPPSAGPATITIQVDDIEALVVELGARRSRLDRALEVIVPIERRADGDPCRIEIKSDTFSPAELLGTDDHRQLGVPLLGMHAGSGITAPLRRFFPAVHRHPQLTYVDSYSLIAANAEFTRGFVQRWWGVDAEVLYPPVSMQATGTKRPMILSVGRFFHADRGHSKKQLEMVRAFSLLCADGLEGWELHLVGGCSPEDEPYLDEVVAAASGLPVVIHRDASGEELRQLYAEASIFWSITGMGEDPRGHPARFEHFGITTVEAMSAGVVPVVLAQGGQVETVQDLANGLHIHDLAGLAERTGQLIADPELRAVLSAGATLRAEAFGPEAFGVRIRELVALAVADPSDQSDPG